MKHLIPFLFTLLLLAPVSAPVAAQVTSMTTYSFNFPRHEALKTFQPYAYPKQNKEIGKDTDLDSSRLANQILAVVILLSIILVTIFLIRRSTAWWLKILIGLGSLGIWLFVAYLFLIIDAYSAMAPPVAKGRAIDRLLNLSRELGLEWMSTVHPKDDNYSFGMIVTLQELVLVDYKNNRGWLIPKGEIASLIADPDETFISQNPTVDLVPENKPGEEGNLGPPQDLVIILKGAQPKQLRLQWGDFLFSALNVAEECKLLWEREE